MSWGVALRNAVGLGLGGIPSLLNAALYPRVGFNFLSGQLDPRITFTRASTGTYVNSSGVLSSAAVNEPRFDYNQTTLAPLGLLIEEQRTNQHSYSEDLSQWGAPANATVSTNVAVAPDGATTADKLVEDTATSLHFLSANTITHSYVSGTLYTRSCFLKAAGRFIVSVYLPGSAFPASSRQALFNLNTGTVYSVESGVTASIQAFGNGWYRCFITATASVTGFGHVGGSALIDDAGNGTYLGNGVSGALIWGAQMEVASFATSYIPTTTTALTRAADVATVTGANFSSWFNVAQGTMFVEYQGVNDVSGATRRAIEVGVLGSTDNRYVIGYSATNQTRSLVIASAVAQADIYVNATQANVVKAAVGYAANNINSAANGTIGTLDTSATIPTVSMLWLGAAEGSVGNTVLNGYIRSFKYYPTRLRDSALQLLTR